MGRKLFVTSDISGAPYQYFLNLPFGEEMAAQHSTTAEFSSRYKFNAKELDQETGWYYYGARYYDPSVSQCLSVDPLAEKFPAFNPYNYTMNNPINVIDPDGRSGEPVIDKKNKTITVTSNITFYGSAGSSELATKAAANIQSQWNEANGKTTIDGIEYSVRFVVTGTYDSKLSADDIKNNTDIKNNYIKIVESGVAVSYMDGAGSNTGVFLKKNISDSKSTTEAHEFGHGYGLEHPTNTDLRGKGQPGIMYPRGTLVDAEYTYNPKKGASKVNGTTGARSNTVNPTTRKVTQQDINNLGLNKIKYNSSGVGKLGKLTNIAH